MMNVINKITKCFSDNHLIDDNILKEYIIDLVNQEEIEDYFSNLNISYGKSSDYNAVNHTMTINPIDLFYERPKSDFEIITMNDLLSDDERKIKICNANKLNIYNIFQINHELTHAL